MNDAPIPAGRRLLRALMHRNYRRFFIGQAVSLLGTWMQQTALTWLVWELSHDQFLVGLNNFAGQAPALVLLPVAGVLVDRWSRLRVVMATQALAMVQAFVLAGLVLFDEAGIWQLMALAFGLGCVNAFDFPGRQALLPELLERREDLSNAIALNSSLFNAARLAGPALAGPMLTFHDGGAGWCFLVNALSFVAVLVSLTGITVIPPSVQAPTKPQRVVHGLVEGLRFVNGHGPIRALLVVVATVGFIAMPYTVLVPMIADNILHGGAGTYSALLTASGCGALTGAIYLASRPNMRGSASRIVVAGIVAALSIGGLALSETLVLSLLLILFTSMNIMFMVVSANTIVQSIVPDHVRGRVMSLYTLAFLGLTPFGAVVGSAVAKSWGPRAALLGSAAGCLLAALSFLPSVDVVRAAIRAHIGKVKQLPQPSEPPFSEAAEEAPHV